MKELNPKLLFSDLSEFDKKLAVITEEMDATKEEVLSSVTQSVNRYSSCDTKHDLRDDLVRMEKILDKVENDIDMVEDEATALMDGPKKDTRDMIVMQTIVSTTRLMVWKVTSKGNLQHFHR